MAGLVGGRDNFRKSVKNLIRKLQKGIILAYFFKTCVKFLRVWTKNTNGWEIFEKILKIFDENAIEK